MIKRQGWSKEEKEFLAKWYGAIHTTEIVRILGRGTPKILNCKVTKSKIIKNEKQFGVITIVYKGETFQAKGFKYAKTKDGTSTINMLLKRKRRYATRTSREERILEAARIEERRSKSNLRIGMSTENGPIKPYIKPEGKVLTLVSGGRLPLTYKYL